MIMEIKTTFDKQYVLKDNTYHVVVSMSDNICQEENIFTKIESLITNYNILTCCNERLVPFFSCSYQKIIDILNDTYESIGKKINIISYAFLDLNSARKELFDDNSIKRNIAISQKIPIPESKNIFEYVCTNVINFVICKYTNNFVDQRLHIYVTYRCNNEYDINQHNKQLSSVIQNMMSKYDKKIEMLTKKINELTFENYDPENLDNDIKEMLKIQKTLKIQIMNKLNLN